MYLSIVVVGLYFLPVHIAFAAADTAVRVASVEYYEEQIIVLNNNNSKIYYATEVEASKNNWEVINADPGLFTMIDFSWLTQTADYILVVKGDNDPTQSRIMLGKKPSKLEISVNYSNMESLAKDDTIATMVNIMSDVGDGLYPVTFDDLEWRKGTTGQWQTTRTLTVGLLEKYLVNGTYLYFRIRALDDVVKATYNNVPLSLNDERLLGITGGIRSYDDPSKFKLVGTNPDGSVKYPDGINGRRFSNEVKVRIVKQSAPMVYGIDGERFTAEIKYGKEYRIAVNNGTPSDWIQVTDKLVKELPLLTMLNATQKNPGNIITGEVKDHEYPVMTIEIRDYATPKAAASKIKSTYLKKQRTLDQGQLISRAIQDDSLTNNNNIYISYNGDKNLIIQIPGASPDLPYEYCVFKDGEDFNMARAAWTSITKGTEVKILASKAVEGGTLYVRKKEIQSKKATATKAAVDFELASTYVTHEIKYPSMPEIADATYTFTKGYSGDVSFTVTLGSDPFETSIQNIKMGTRDIEFTPENIESGGVKTIKVTLKKESLTSMTNCYNRYIYIYYTKGTVDKTSVKLTIQSPTPAGGLTVSIDEGSSLGTTTFTMVSSKGVNNKWVYVVGDNVIDKINTQDTLASKTSLTPINITGIIVENINVNLDQYLTIFELDKDGFIIKFKCIKITSEMLKLS
jgi:hypothetical protein